MTSQRRDLERMGCTSNRGTFQEMAYTATGRLGRCIRDRGTATERTTHHYSWDVNTHQTLCTREGHVWMAM